jgi:hypothetical protein
MENTITENTQLPPNTAKAAAAILRFLEKSEREIIESKREKMITSNLISINKSL